MSVSDNEFDLLCKPEAEVRQAVRDAQEVLLNSVLSYDVAYSEKELLGAVKRLKNVGKDGFYLQVRKNFSSSDMTLLLKKKWEAGDLERKPKGGVWYYRLSFQEEDTVWDISLYFVPLSLAVFYLLKSFWVGFGALVGLLLIFAVKRFDAARNKMRRASVPFFKKPSC